MEGKFAQARLSKMMLKKFMINMNHSKAWRTGMWILLVTLILLKEIFSVLNLFLAVLDRDQYAGLSL